MTFPFFRLTVVFVAFAACVMTAVTPLPARGAEEETPAALPAADTQIKEVADALERFKQYDFDGALMKFKEAAEKHPELSPGEVNMAKVFAGIPQGRGAKAFRFWLEKAVVAEPNDPEAFIFIADMALREGRMAEASLVYAKAESLMAAFSNAERKKNLEPRIYSGLAGVAESREDWETAKGHLNAWLKIQSDNTTALQRLARALFKTRESQEALNKLKAAKAADPKVLNPAAQLARFYHAVPDYKNAKIWMEFAQKSERNDLPTQLVVAQWYLETGDLDKAETIANGAMRVDPNSMDAKILRGVIALFKKDYASGEVYFQSVLSKSPSHFVAKNNLALAFCEQGDNQKTSRALAYADENARLNPKSAEAASTLGWVLYKAGRLKDADTVLTKVARAGRVSEDTAYFIAVVAAELGRTDQAKTVLESALKSKRPFSKRDEAQALLKKLQ